jgi:outer membrane cobalamin receptor
VLFACTMIRPDRTARSIAVFCWGAGMVLLLAAPARASSWAGRPLAEALNGLRSPGFSIIFSSELVPDTLQVRSEPPPGPPADMARQLLEPFGLGLKNVAPGLFAVVRSGSAAEPAPASAGASAPPNASRGLEQVVIAASRYTLASDDGAHRVDTGDIAEQPKYADDPLRVVARLPGVTNNGESGRLNVRGGSDDEVLFLVDGFPVRQAFHVPALQAPFSAFDASLVSTIDVYTGGFPLRYGERMSGVVDLSTLPPDLEPHTSLSASNVSIGARTAGVISEARGVDGLIAARAGRLDNLTDRLATDVQSPTFSDGLAKLRWRLSESATIAAETLWSQDNVALQDSTRGEFAHLSSRTVYFWLSGEQRINEQWRAEGWLGYSALHSLREGQVDNPNVVMGRVSDARNSDLWDVRWQMHGTLSERHTVEFGGEWHVGDADYAYQNVQALTPEVAQLYGKPLHSSLDTLLSPYRRDAALYFADRMRIGSSTTTEWGMRVQHAAGLGLESTWLWDPRVMVSFDLDDRTRLRASWGRFHQPDGVQELRVEDGEVGFARPQSSDHVIIDLEHVDRHGIAWRTELYDKRQAASRVRYENELNPLSLLPELEPDRVRIDPNGAELRGLEVSAGYSSKLWTWHLNYSWSHASDEVGGLDYLRSWDQTHTINGSLSWRHGRWSLGSALTAHTGWPTTRLLYDAAGTPVLGPRNGARWPYYASLDLASGYRLPVRRGEVLFALDITNVLDRQNSCCSELIAPPAGVAVDSLTLLPFTATASARWNF